MKKEIIEIIEKANKKSERIIIEENRKNYISYKILFEEVFDSVYPIIEMTPWSIAPELGVWIYNRIIDKKYENIVELGGGTSTLIIAQAIKKHQLDTKLTTIEHDYVYYNKTLELLDKTGLIEFVNVLFCPLTDYILDNGKYSWYDINLDSLADNIDLLIIDGPPGSTCAHSRYPALPILFEKLSENVEIIFDDCQRKAEKEIIEEWIFKYGDISYEVIENIRHEPILLYDIRGLNEQFENTICIKKLESKSKNSDLSKIKELESSLYLSQKKIASLKSKLLISIDNIKELENKIINVKSSSNKLIQEKNRQLKKLKAISSTNIKKKKAILSSTRYQVGDLIAKCLKSPKDLLLSPMYTIKIINKRYKIKSKLRSTIFKNKKNSTPLLINKADVLVSTRDHIVYENRNALKHEVYSTKLSLLEASINAKFEVPSNVRAPCYKVKALEALDKITAEDSKVNIVIFYFDPLMRHILAEGIYSDFDKEFSTEENEIWSDEASITARLNLMNYLALMRLDTDNFNILHYFIDEFDQNITNILKLIDYVVIAQEPSNNNHKVVKRILNEIKINTKVIFGTEFSWFKELKNGDISEADQESVYYNNSFFQYASKADVPSYLSEALGNETIIEFAPGLDTDVIYPSIDVCDRKYITFVATPAERITKNNEKISILIEKIKRSKDLKKYEIKIIEPPYNTKKYWEIINDTAFFILTSAGEAYNYILNDAKALGVITFFPSDLYRTNIGGVYYVENFPESNIKYNSEYSLIKKIEAMSNNEIEMDCQSKLSREFVVKNFSLNKLKSNWETLFINKEKL